MLFTKNAVFSDNVRKQLTIQSYLDSRGFTIISTGNTNDKYLLSSLLDLSERIVNLQMNGGEKFIKYIRTSIIHKTSQCSFSLAKLSDAEKKATIDIANELCSFGILTKSSVIKNDILDGSFNFTARFSKFISGEFLEIAVYKLVLTLLEDLKSRVDDLDYEVLTNVIATNKQFQREYDLFLRLKDQVFLFEMKSGRAEDFAYYYTKGVELGLYPDNLFVVLSDRTHEELELLTHFHEMNITNYAKLHDILISLFNNY